KVAAGIVGEPDDARPVGVHYVDLRMAVARADEGQPCAVGGPCWGVVVMRIPELADARAIAAHQADLFVVVTIAHKGDLATRRDRHNGDGSAERLGGVAN